MLSSLESSEFVLSCKEYFDDTMSTSGCALLSLSPATIAMSMSRACKCCQNSPNAIAIPIEEQSACWDVL